MRLWVWMLGGAALLMALHANAAAAGNAAAGKQKASACRGCHGDTGVSTDATVPKLAGQFSDYLVKQIGDFQSKKRQDERMPHTLATASAQDLQDISMYFSAQPMMKGASSNSPAAQLGKSIYEMGVAEREILGCVGCHGPKGKGAAKRQSSWDDAFYPIVGGQHKAYLVKQLNDFRSGKRKTDLSGVMVDIAKTLTPDEMNAVVEYMAGL